MRSVVYPEKVLLVGSSRYAPEGISEKEIILETTDMWEMLELLRLGLDGRYYLEDVAYDLLTFSVVNKVYALYFGGIIMTKILQSLVIRWRRR